MIQHEQHNSYSDKLEDITFFLRFPASLAEGERPRGVLADINYLSEPKRLKEWISKPAAQRGLFQFAEKNKLVVVTWTTATLYNAGKSYQGDKDSPFAYKTEFERTFKSWNRGMNALCKEYNLPERDFLIYGISRGAQWAHRLVLTDPDRFLAVHAHVNSSYDRPDEAAKSCLWLITTGDREHGYPDAIRFYRRCQELGYPILFKSQGNLGHDDSSQIGALGLRFFEYAWELKAKRDGIRQEEAKDIMGPKTIPKTGFPAYLLSDFFKAPYVGDLLNGDVFPVARAGEIPEKLRVPVPTEAIAKAWGFYQP